MKMDSSGVTRPLTDNTSKYRMEQKNLGTRSNSSNPLISRMFVARESLIMERRRFPLLLLALFFCAQTLAEATDGPQMPGYLYARTRGRCTPQYWSSRRESWPKMVPQTSTVSNVFSSLAYERYRYDLTLLEAASMNDDGDTVFAALLKQSTAALLNSYARKGYPYAAWEVKTLLIQALVSEDAAALQARKFMQANEDCG